MRRPRRPKDDADAAMHGALENWGAWARGLGAHLGYPSPRPSGPVPLEEPARAVEAAILALRVRRPSLYHFALSRYVAQDDELTTCQRLRIRGHNYRQNQMALYRYVQGYLDATAQLVY